MKELLTLVGFIILYLLPTIIIGIRQLKRAGGFVLVNVFLGWTIIGRIIPMVFALFPKCD